MASRAEKNGMAYEDNNKARTTVNPEGVNEPKRSGGLDLEAIDRSIRDFREETKKRHDDFETRMKEIQSTIGVLSKNDAKQREDIDALDKRVSALEGKSSATDCTCKPAPVSAQTSAPAPAPAPASAPAAMPTATANHEEKPSEAAIRVSVPYRVKVDQDDNQIITRFIFG